MASTKRTFDPESYRSDPEIQGIVRQLVESTQLTVPPETIEELKGYLDTAKYIPKIVDADKIKSVRKAQYALQRIQATLDRVITIHFDVRYRIELLNRTEIAAKAALIRLGAIPEKSSGPAQQLVLTGVIPELMDFQYSWDDFEKLCGMVHKNLSDAKETLKLQIKLEDIIRWGAQRTL